MEDDLSSIISQLRLYRPIGTLPLPSALKFVLDYPRFVQSLENIHNMIGLQQVKKQLSLQIKSFMANYRLYGNPTNNEKLHTMLYGPPGCGKTQLGKYLAEFWSSSGCLSSSGDDKLFEYGPEDDSSIAQSAQDQATIRFLSQQLQRTENEILGVIQDFNHLHWKMRDPNIDNFYIRNRITKFRNRLSRIVPRRKPPPPPPPPPSVKFAVVTRGDLVGKYQGHTTAQVREILKANIGGVLMIDEAYNLCTSTHDTFGREALTEIISFMTTWPDKIIFIFAGYRDQIEASILKFQPGLARRFNWIFEIEGYTPEELSDIFISQLALRSWKILPKDKDQLASFFRKNKDKFPYFGGDTEKLCSFIRDAHYQHNWLKVLDDTIPKEEIAQLFNYINYDIIQIAFTNFLDNSAQEKAEKRDLAKISHMYI